MPNTVPAKLLLGWMREGEAVDVLDECIFEKHLTRRRAVALWKDYRAKVLALEPRHLAPLQTIALSPEEQLAVEAHIQRIHAGPNAAYFSQVIKVHPSDLVAHQYHVLTERSAEYGQQMQNEQNRIDRCLGVGL